MKLFRAIVALSVFSFFPAQNLMAHETSLFANIPMNLTVGTGMINGSYSSPIDEASAESITMDTGFALTPSLSLMFEFFTAVDKSWHIKSQLAFATAERKMKYSFLGAGANYYFGGGNIMSSMDEKWMHYAGYDIGLSRSIVVSFGPALDAVSTAFDFGGHIGTNYRLNKEWNINAEVGASYSIGFETVATTGTNIKTFIGISHVL